MSSLCKSAADSVKGAPADSVKGAAEDASPGAADSVGRRSQLCSWIPVKGAAEMLYLWRSGLPAPDLSECQPS